MLQRCCNKNHKAFPRYGGRGITVYQMWKDFIPFRDWALANGYRDDLTIDRINNDDGYYPANCRWIPLSENISKERKGQASYFKSVNQFDLNGNLIATYSSAMEAERYTGISSRHISNVRSGTRKTAGGFVWKC